MKGYEEAMMTGAVDADRPDLDSALAAVKDHVTKFSSLLEEIEGHPLTPAIVRVIKTAITGRPADCECEACQEISSAIMTAFLNGVRIGMEMERQELPEA